MREANDHSDVRGSGEGEEAEDATKPPMAPSGPLAAGYPAAPVPPASSPRRGLPAVPEGTPYHRMARTQRHRWWRPLLGTVVVLAVWVATAVVLSLVVLLGALLVGGLDAMNSIVLLPGASSSASQALVAVALSLAILAVGIPGILLAAWGIQRRSAGTVSSVTGRLRWRWLGMCFAVATPLLGVTLAITYAIPVQNAGPAESAGAGWVGWGRFLIAAVVLLALVPLQSAAEEYAFRGWVLQTAGAYVRTPWVGIGIGAVLFALGHGLGTGWGFADLIFYSLVTGWLVLRTGGLEAGIALHAVNNLLAFLVAAATGTLSVTETAATAPWYLFAIDLVALPLYAWVIIVLGRRREIARYAPAPRAAMGW